jgi:hypothetical protein
MEYVVKSNIFCALLIRYVDIKGCYKIVVCKIDRRHKVYVLLKSCNRSSVQGLLSSYLYYIFVITGLLGYVHLIVKIRFDLMIHISDIYNKMLLHSNLAETQTSVADTLLEEVHTTSVIPRHDCCHNWDSPIFCAVRVEGKETVERQECQL